MNIKSLGLTAAFTLLAITESAMAQEPGAVTTYKSKVSREISTWATSLDTDNVAIHKAAEEWRVVKDKMAKATKARESLESEGFKLEAAKKELEKKRDDFQKDAAKQVDAVKKATALALASKTTEDIKKKTAEITTKTADIKKAADEEKKVQPDLDKKKGEVANAVKSAGIHNGIATAIGLIPASDLAGDKKVMEKDTRGAYRTEWGPALATWMEGQLQAKRWNEIGTSVKVSWTQSGLEKKMAPVVTVTLKLPDVNAAPARGALNMRP